MKIKNLIYSNHFYNFYERKNKIRFKYKLKKVTYVTIFKTSTIAITSTIFKYKKTKSSLDINQKRHIYYPYYNFQELIIYTI